MNNKKTTSNKKNKPVKSPVCFDILRLLLLLLFYVYIIFFSSGARRTSTCPLFDYKGSNFDPNGWDPFVRIENGFRQHAVNINRYAGECGVKVCRLAVDSFIH